MAGCAVCAVPIQLGSRVADRAAFGAGLCRHHYEQAAREGRLPGYPCVGGCGTTVERAQGRSERNAICESCRIEQRRTRQRAYHWANRDASIERNRRFQQATRADPQRRWKVYAARYNQQNGTSIDGRQAVALWREQDGRCAICGCDLSPDREPQLSQKVGLDHDHATGRIRQWLCKPCNVGIGWFGDDPERVRRAAAYLERWKTDPSDRDAR